MTLCFVNVIFLWWMKQRHIFYIFCAEFSFSDVGIWWCKKFSDSLKIQSSYIEKIKEQLSLSFAFSLIYRYQPWAWASWPPELETDLIGLLAAMVRIYSSQDSSCIMSLWQTKSFSSLRTIQHKMKTEDIFSKSFRALIYESFESLII